MSDDSVHAALRSDAPLVVVEAPAGCGKTTKGADYAREFDAIFPALASTHRVVFYPFFLDGVATDAKLNQSDGLHPNAAGVDVIVERMLPKVEELIAAARAARGLGSH